MPQQSSTPSVTSNPNAAEARAPEQTAEMIERRRVLELGKNIGRTEQLLDRLEERFNSLAGSATSAELKTKWETLMRTTRTSIREAEQLALGGEGDYAAIDRALRESRVSLGVIDGLLAPTSKSASSIPELGITPVIAFDPQDITGMAALKSIIDLSQDPQRVDELLSKLGIDKRLEGESLGRAIQRSMLRTPSTGTGASSPTSPSTNPKDLVLPPIRPNEKGDFTGRSGQ